jgi:hypothetical protein
LKKLPRFTQIVVVWSGVVLAFGLLLIVTDCTPPAGFCGIGQAIGMVLAVWGVVGLLSVVPNLIGLIAGSVMVLTGTHVAVGALLNGAAIGLVPFILPLAVILFGKRALPYYFRKEESRVA